MKNTIITAVIMLVIMGIGYQILTVKNEKTLEKANKLDSIFSDKCPSGLFELATSSYKNSMSTFSCIPPIPTPKPITNTVTKTVTVDNSPTIYKQVVTSLLSYMKSCTAYTVAVTSIPSNYPTTSPVLLMGDSAKDVVAFVCSVPIKN